MPRFSLQLAPVVLAAVLGVANVLPAQAPAARVFRPDEGVRPQAHLPDLPGGLPQRKHEALPGKIVGILLADAQPVLSTEGRSGPADQLCLGRNGCSYRWVYVPTKAQPHTISNLRVPVGNNGEFQVYPALDLARPASVQPFGITGPFSLVAVEVNDGKGSPAGDSFVATRLTKLDGSMAYPLKTGVVLATLRGRQADQLKEMAKEIDAALTAARKKASQDQPANAGRTQSDLVFLTWLEDAEIMRVLFRTRIADGAFLNGDPRPDPRRAPPVLPVLPIQPKQQRNDSDLNGTPAEENSFVRVAPILPPPLQGRVGTSFGIEFGIVYDVSKDGTILREQRQPIMPFQQNNGPLPGRPRGGPDRILPVPPRDRGDL